MNTEISGKPLNGDAGRVDVSGYSGVAIARRGNGKGLERFELWSPCEKQFPPLLAGEGYTYSVAHG
ncbi:hypothetical protein GCM10007901_21040 [Dyella acidisoli]|uniref:Uncharacterized protein n=1 Tax=Dyella acidisoli TaxID=1867834 RepID=A0ABQ5XNJ7_9GAMM|nr:hypothetical protein GCM10007901_21040 [Dyella acidisoli]